jgi:lipopolysaccharide heptosyltransferase I
MEKILVIRLTSMGDLVHTLPAVAALRETFPNAQIDWVVERKWAPILEGTPAVNRIITMDPKPIGKLTEAVREIRSVGYDTAIDFQGLYKSATLALLSKASRRVGFDIASAREPAAAFLYTERVKAGGPHAVNKNFSLVEHMGVLRPARPLFPMHVSESAGRAVKERLAANGISDYVVVNPGASCGFKCWPADRFGVVCRELERRHGWKSVVAIGPGEDALAEELRKTAAPTQPVVFPASLTELMALLASARMVIAADTGPLHLAAALGTPVVGIYGPTDPVKNGPVGGKFVVVRNARPEETSNHRRAAHSPAILRVTIDEVLDAVERLETKSR